MKNINITTALITPEQQLDEILFGMKPREIEFIYNQLKDPRNDYMNFLPIRWKIITLVQWGFYSTLYHFYKKYSEGEDKVKAIEEVIDVMSPKLREHIIKLEFGIVMGSVGIKLHRLPNNFGKLKNLRKLYLNQQPIEDFSPMKDLRLEFLCAEECRITDPSPVSLERLSWYNLQYSQVKDVAYLKDGVLLGWLKLARTQIDESQLENIMNTENVYEFDISECEQLKNLPQRLGDFELDPWSKHYLLADKEERERRKRLISVKTRNIIDYFYCDMMAF